METGKVMTALTMTPIGKGSPPANCVLTATAASRSIAGSHEDESD
jgi:hypothetical protein